MKSRQKATQTWIHGRHADVYERVKLKSVQLVNAIFAQVLTNTNANIARNRNTCTVQWHNSACPVYLLLLSYSVVLLLLFLLALATVIADICSHLIYENHLYTLLSAIGILYGNFSLFIQFIWCMANRMHHYTKIDSLIWLMIRISRK